MDARQIAVAAETHLDDLQADMEAGSRLVDQIHHKGAQVRDTKPSARPLIDSLLKQIVELKACVMQQRRTARELRHDIRNLRQYLKNA
jgi:ABC-type transporter Mla subunit MlaD